MGAKCPLIHLCLKPNHLFQDTTVIKDIIAIIIKDIISIVAVIKIIIAAIIKVRALSEQHDQQ